MRTRAFFAVTTSGLLAALLATPPATGRAPVTPAGSPVARPAVARTDQITPVTVAPTTVPLPVKATDGRTHLVYELELTNMSTLPATLTAVRVTAGEGTLEELSGARLLRVFRPSGAPAEQPARDMVLQPGRQGRVWLDVLVPAGTAFPITLAHAVSVTYPEALGIIPKAITEYVAPLGVPDRRPVVLRPPLAGGGWLDANGCCATITAHRSAASPVDGRARFGERFAIDFVRLDHGTVLFDGPPDQVGSYPYYGTPVRAAADGRIVSVTDEYPDKKPGSATPDMPLAQYTGNNVVQQLASGEYVLYAHLKPGSTRVLAGSTVKAGEVLGALGSSGNSDAPHLHFEVMSATSPFTSEGLPFVFSSFALEGTVTPTAFDDALASGSGSITVTPPRGARDRTREMPLYLDVLRFPPTP
ncbi:M23 family metallopeptidase [Streptomyces sp. NPDC090077]|uniref:M23 family metallopeptidase n=1 Tax=Streptomyces sp. NPDC090077 TaxID=3365938 RepID=UPI0037F3ED8D